MSKPLFDNVGKDLKLMAESIAKGIIITHWCIGAALIIAAFPLLEPIPIAGIISLCAGIGVICYGYSKARMQVITLYAYGEITEKVVSIERQLTGDRNGGDRNGGDRNGGNRNGGDPDLPVTIRNVDGTWYCLSCGHKNMLGAIYCEDCGKEAKFE